MLIQNNLKSQFVKILWITMGWVFISVFNFFTIYAGLLNLKMDISNIDPWLYLKGNVIAGVLAGIIGGSVMVFFWEKWLRTKNYGWSLWSILWTYSVIYFVVGIPTGIFVESSELGLLFYDLKVFQSVMSETFSLGGLQSYVFWLLIVIGTLITLLVNDKYGPGVFKDFLLGKYFHPKKEERIFMFLDLRSSTSIAERLGEERYFSFLKDVFNYSTSSILNHQGEIYQYVGDEIVISWKTELGAENANCIECFFDIQKALKNKSDHFESNYGLLPEFKAGLHYGYVMAGEIGVVKRDIAFSGDVLNTTSRIQDKCNELGVDLLISKFLLDKLNLGSDSYEPKEIGNIKLRGKEQRVALFTV